MGRTLLIARTELMRRLRNRSAIVTAVIGPLAMAVVFGLLIGGAGSGGFTIGVVAGDPAARVLVAPGAGGEGVGFRPVAGLAAARSQVDDGDLDAALVVPAGSLSSARAGRLVVVGDPASPVARQVAEGVAQGLAGRADQVRLAVATTATRARAAPSAGLIARARALPEAVTVVGAAAEGPQADAAAYFGASMSILFLFFTVGFAARSLIAERQGGTLVRVLSTPTSAGALVAGKVIAVCVLGLVGLLVVWGVTALVFGASWGPPGPVLALMVATVLAVGGVATLVASLARTEQQADAYTSMVAFAFAVLGGNFLGPGVAPELLERLSFLTPNGWALAAFTDLEADAATAGSLATAIAVLLGFAVVFGAAGIWRVRRTLAR